MAEVSVAAATEKLLERFGGDAEASPEAALAVSLAKRIDDQGNSATSASMNAGKLLDALAAVRALAPPTRELDKIDELAEKRAGRRSAGGARAADLPGS